MLANAFYAGFYTWELNSGTLANAILGLKLEYVVVSVIPVFWFLFARLLGGRVGPFSKGKTMLLFIVPIVTIGLMATNEQHHWLFTSLGLRTDTDLARLVAQRGPWYWVSVAYLYSLMAMGTVFIFLRWLRRTGKFRGQFATLLVAVGLAWLGHGLLLFDLSPWGLDPTPFLFSISGVFLAVGIFRFQLLGLIPLARERVVDAIGDGVLVLDQEGRVVDTNQALRAAFPALANDDPTGRLAQTIFSPLDFALPREGTTREVRVDTPGEAHWYKVSSLALREKQRHQGTVVLFSDITETKRLLTRLSQWATTDELTQIDNRRRFFEHANREIDRVRRQGGSLSFAILDIDHFKDVNDTYGHASGDSALVRLTEVCRATLRSTDLLCRYGGEEFVMIFPDTPVQAAAEVSDRVRRAIAETKIDLGSSWLTMTVSIGVSGSDGAPYLEVEQYLKAGDSALYQAKAQGRNQVVVADRIPSPLGARPGPSKG